MADFQTDFDGTENNSLDVAPYQFVAATRERCARVCTRKTSSKTAIPV